MSILANADNSLTVVLDGERQELPEQYARAGTDPWRPARDLANLLEQSVFAELVDATGDRYTHVFDPDASVDAPIITHPDAPVADAGTAAVAEAALQLRPPAFSITGDGFAPGEDVYIAVVVATRTARLDGVAQLPLPGALLNRLPGVLIMFGLDSQTLIVSDPTAESATAGGGRAA
ncbi:hypothetical protein [Pengzhenrongella sicca]|uniref:Uncharacterized protein n=1 Tax=Pengzhenrongella sicca TaxID=2819238 RepID=A0A8A4ZB28_9MICO|nr:hypothetical protein [Pengzhenrongella sicca]QTE28625.1 hypothetical protein J4E96_14855 [Pengzhenrongella sicca]